MKNFKKNIYRLSEEGVIILDSFDYAIITYQYIPPLGLDYDLDTISAFRYTNSSVTGLESVNIAGLMATNSAVGCGTLGGIAVPSGSTFSNGYLFWGEDDVIQNQDGTYGESIVVNFKNLKNLAITTSPNIAVDLFAGWHSPAIPSNFSYPIKLKYETFIGGVISKEVVGGVTTNRFVSTGTSVSTPQISDDIPIPVGTCHTGPDVKKRIATINFNLDTKQSSLIFY
jgi:hypothetical protein